MIEIKGIIPPIITPMNEDETINEQELGKQKLWERISFLLLHRLLRRLHKVSCMSITERWHRPLIYL